MSEVGQSFLSSSKLGRNDDTLENKRRTNAILRAKYIDGKERQKQIQYGTRNATMKTNLEGRKRGKQVNSEFDTKGNTAKNNMFVKKIYIYNSISFLFRVFFLFPSLISFNSFIHLSFPNSGLPQPLISLTPNPLYPLYILLFLSLKTIGERRVERIED